MAVKVYAGLQTAEKIKATTLVDLGATDFNMEENVSMITSEVFQNVQAAGDSAVAKIEISGGVPIELTVKTLELLLPGLSYNLNGGSYLMSNDRPAFFTVVLEDLDNDVMFEYVDCVINTFNIKVAIGAFVTADLDFIGKNMEITSGLVDAPEERGESLRALYSTITLDGVDVTEDIESLDINISNGMEAKGAINSLYNVKTRRSAQMTTEVVVEKNEYEHSDFTSMRAKMLAGTPAVVGVTLGDGENELTVDVLKAQIAKNTRGDYKGSGSHSLAMNCSVENKDNSHLKFTLPVV